jgi:hypothetical protein
MVLLSSFHMSDRGIKQPCRTTSIQLEHKERLAIGAEIHYIFSNSEAQRAREGYCDSGQV